MARISAGNKIDFFIRELGARRPSPGGGAAAALAGALGAALAAAGKLGEAVVAYAKAVDLYPYEASWWTDEGDVLTKLGRTAEAQQCYKKADQREQELDNLDAPLVK